MTDIEIARSVKKENIENVAKKLGLKKSDIMPYGEYMAKIKKTNFGKKQGKLVLVSAINPTKAGIGKTTVSIGLADALSSQGEKVCLALREPSLGPVFGVKGGATGGGMSQVVPMEEINLHFTGDFHAITTANNLLCSMVDNSIFYDNPLDVDPDTIVFCRCMDLNERSLREVELLVPVKRKERFVITAASEIMAVLCVAKNMQDLVERLGNIYVCKNKQGQPLFAKDFGAHNAMAVVLKNAIMPNLVQTLEGTPAIVHCGPFANIAHGCNSVVATKTALNLADYCITEAGFGADLGAEKFIDFKCRIAGLVPDCVVLVATIKALKLHGGANENDLEKEDVEAVKRGLCNLQHHVEVVKNVFNLNVVVTLNKYVTDTKKEVEVVEKAMKGIDFVVNDVWGKGSAGGQALAEKVKKCCNKKSEIKFAYDLSDSVEQKIEKVVKKVYGGSGVVFGTRAKRALETIYQMGLEKLPVIIAKTQFSLSDDKSKIGRPQNFVVDVKDIEIKTGAGFLVVVCGNILLMPALSKKPAALGMKIDANGVVDGLF